MLSVISYAILSRDRAGSEKGLWVETLSYRELIILVSSSCNLSEESKDIVLFKRKLLTQLAQEERTLTTLKAASPFTNKSKLFTKDLS